MTNSTITRSGQPVLQSNTENGIDYLTFPMLSQTGLVRHMFTTRIGGASQGIYSSMNLSFTRGDDSQAVMENFRRIAALFDADLEAFVCSDQTHTTNIRHVTAADRGKGVVHPKDYHDIDGLITDVPGLILSTFYADCVPLYFVDAQRKAIGLSHSGWRGTADGIGAKTLQAMAEAFGTRPEETYAAIGPAICGDCYEVSEEVADRFRGMDMAQKPGRQVLRAGKRPGKYQLDLREANRCLLLEAGILPEHLEVADICTCCNPDYLFSHRASGGKRGNLGAFLTILRKY